MLIQLFRAVGVDVIVIFALLLNGGNVFAQNEDDEALFRRGMILYRQGKYVSARLDFKEIVTNYSSSSFIVPSHMMLAKTFFNLGEFERAESTAREHRNRFPKSPYFDWTYYMISACKFRMGDVNQAALLLSELAGKTKNVNLRERSLNAIRNVILPVVDNDIIYTMLENNGIKRTDLDTVKSFDSSTGGEQTVTDIFTDSDLSRRRFTWETGSTIKIGLLSPITGVNSDLGLQLQSGVQAALKNNLSGNGITVELIVEDTESDPVTAVIKTRRLIEKGVVAIIGPVLSESTIPCAVESQAHGITFVAPTTTNAKFTHIGRYVFQLNFNPVIQAEALADFAVTMLNSSNFAVIADNDPWGVIVANTFSDEMERRGANNIWIGFLSLDTQQSNDELFMNIREHAPRSQALLDSMMVIDYGNAFTDTIILKRDLVLRGERQFEPVDTIDCIIVSATSEKAVQIASQIMEYNINTVILGDSGWWTNEKVFQGGEQYLEGAYVVAPPGELSGGFGLSYSDDISGQYDRYDLPFMKGVDACGLLLHCFQNGVRDPEALVDMLESIRDFRGVASRITIDPERHTNQAVAFIRIQNGRYIVVGKETSNNQLDGFNHDIYQPIDNSLSVSP